MMAVIIVVVFEIVLAVVTVVAAESVLVCVGICGGSVSDGAFSDLVDTVVAVECLVMLLAMEAVVAVVLVRQWWHWCHN